MPLQRDRELNRLYMAVALGVLIYSIFWAYKLISAQVGAGMDAPSRWSLLALGLTNLLAIVALLWIVARSLAKLYFERRSGILGSRIRTRLVVAIFTVALVPSLLLFLVGRNFIAKNVDRWFLPETQEVMLDGKALAEALDAQVAARIETARASLTEEGHGDTGRLRSQLGLDLLARGDGRGLSVAPGLPLPGDLAARIQDLSQGRWHLAQAARKGYGSWVLGVFVKREIVEGGSRLAQRYRESLQVQRNRDALETIPQSSFLLLTLLTLFAALWTGLTLARTISEPVRALAKAAQRVGQGDLQVQLPELGD